jgi:branched-chain amino acid transport system permease protein
MNRLMGRTGWLLLLALGLVFPFIARNDYHLTVMSTAYIFALATLGLNLITGYTGQFNLAHSGFMAVGAYTVGILTVDHQVPFWWAFPLSGWGCSSCTASPARCWAAPSWPSATARRWPRRWASR